VGLEAVAIKILIVDDERSIVDSLEEIIGSAGYDVVCAYSGKEALAKASEFCPDILLSDVLMPKMHGFELALQIKQICPQCLLLLFSGQAATAQLAQSFAQTFTRLGYRFELLPKPIHPETLLKTLQESLTRAA
jgi:CheY-like chemotaxis protein